MGCGSSSSTTAVVAANAASSDITDAPEKGPMMSGGRSDLVVNGTALSGYSGGNKQLQVAGLVVDQDSGVIITSATSNLTNASNGPPAHVQSNGEVSGHGGGGCEQVVATDTADGALDDRNGMKFDVTLDSPEQENAVLAAPRRLPRLERMDSKKQAASKEDIEEKIAAHDQRRKEELSKRTEAQKTRQTKRDKLRAEVKAARELEAKEAAGNVDELALGVPEEDESCTDVMRGLHDGENDDDHHMGTIAALQFGAGTGLEVLDEPVGPGFGDTGDDDDDEW